MLKKKGKKNDNNNANDLVRPEYKLIPRYSNRKKRCC